MVLVAPPRRILNLLVLGGFGSDAFYGATFLSGFLELRLGLRLVFGTPNTADPVLLLGLGYAVR